MTDFVLDPHEDECRYALTSGNDPDAMLIPGFDECPGCGADLTSETGNMETSFDVNVEAENIDVSREGGDTDEGEVLVYQPDKRVQAQMPGDVQREYREPET